MTPSFLLRKVGNEKLGLKLDDGHESNMLRWPRDESELAVNSAFFVVKNRLHVQNLELSQKTCRGAGRSHEYLR